MKAMVKAYGWKTVAFAAFVDASCVFVAIAFVIVVFR
jgi:hypothetical protein